MGSHRSWTLNQFHSKSGPLDGDPHFGLLEELRRAELFAVGYRAGLNVPDARVEFGERGHRVSQGRTNKMDTCDCNLLVVERYNRSVGDWLDEEEMAAWRGLVDVSAAVMGALEAELVAHHGITTGDYGVLARLSEAENSRMRMCDLASALHLSPSGLTRRLDGLVRRHIVTREPSADDRRVMLAVLTAEGRAFLEQIAPLHLDCVRRYFISQLSRTQLRNLSSAFRSIERGFMSIDSHG